MTCRSLEGIQQKVRFERKNQGIRPIKHQICRLSPILLAGKQQILPFWTFGWLLTGKRIIRLEPTMDNETRMDGLMQDIDSNKKEGVAQNPE